MTKKLKVLGLALVAVFAMNVVVAASAQAAGKFTVTGSGVALSGVQTETNVFETNAGEVECSTATFAGTSTAASETEQSVTPTYSGCTLAGLAATVDFATGGCSYKLTAAGQEINTDIVCSSGTIHVKKTSSECEITVLSQTGIPGITADNTTTSGGAMDILLTIHATGIHYEVHHGEKCPNKPASTTLFTNGTYTGHVTVTAPGGITYDEV